MPQIPLKNLAGEDLGSIDVSAEVFGAPVNEPLVHQAVVRLLANRRLGTHKTKTRGQVSGGGAKPWRQKGTGRARQGSRVSPLWRGGGIVFGPVERGYRQDMPKKMRRSAMRSGLSARLAEGAIIALDNFDLPEIRTKSLALAIQSLGLNGDVLVVDNSFDENALLSARNIASVQMTDAASLNLLDVLGPEHLVFTKNALQAVDKRLAEESN
jgi:large subunit ribosomal protein L4